ncbi:MAG: hypothetical protein J6A21_03810 [Lentisphaeria bacterium]|nr:hypothetical protein [Lentisphaeria bacterium]
MSAPFAPLLMLLLCLFASRREENCSQKAWKCVPVFLLLAGGAAGVFFLPANARTLPEKLSRVHEEKAKADPASTVLAGIVAAGQFSRGVVIHVLGDRTAGKFLRNGPFPARIAVLDTKNPFSEGELPMRVLDRNAFMPGKAGGTHVSPPENPDILFASPGELKFPFDVFLSLRLLRALDGQFAHGRGVFVLLLSCLEGEKAKAAEEEACRRLSRIYANVYAVSTPRMVLASDAALNLDPETLGIRGGEEFFPKGILKIFLPDLKKSPLYRKKGDAEKETFPMMPFSFLLHGEARQGLSGMIRKAFLFWAELLHESYWLFWALFLPGYFVFRYFRSPGEKPKKFFRLFEHAFFLAGFPFGVICLLPEKWLAKELFLSFLLLPALAAFLAAGGIAAGRKNASSGSTPSVSRRILSLLPSLLSSLLPWLGLCLCMAEEEHCTPGPAFFPFALSFFRFSLALLFLLAGAFCGSSLEETMEGLEKEELPRILLTALAGSFLAFSLILPVAFGGYGAMIPLFIFLSFLRICVLRKN